MTDTTLTILLAAIPPTLVALAGLIVSIINSVKADKIHVLVNSNMTEVKQELTTSRLDVKELQGLIAKLAGTNTAPTAADVLEAVILPQ